MDLETIETKLLGRQYATVLEFAVDARRIWENCYLYNGKDFVFSQYASSLSGQFEEWLLKMPEVINNRK